MFNHVSTIPYTTTLPYFTSPTVLPRNVLYHRRLAETRGDFAEAAEMEDYESKKPKLAKANLQCR